jgi:hypothetical protein
MTVEEARRMLQTDKLAQELLGSPIVARLAYTCRDLGQEPARCGLDVHVHDPGASRRISPSATGLVTPFAGEKRSYGSVGKVEL